MSSAALGIETRPRRSRTVAALLSLIAPGIGHLYAGAPRRALVIVLATLALSPAGIGAAMLVPPRFHAVFAFTGILLGAIALGYLVVIIDAVRLAGRAAEGRRMPWFVLLAAVIFLWLTNYLVSSVSQLLKAELPWRTFTVPSSSMEPTVRVGEWLLGDTRHYGKNAPARGDLMIYRLPSDNRTIYLKRIVALPGDRIRFHEGRAVVNGVTASEPFADLGPADAFLNTTAEMTVPADHVFAAGDNRANSSDSRVRQHGTVPLRNLVARATEVFLSEDTARLGLWVGTPAK
jgi:signal peptidase I